jgi:hypothetical protein
MDAANLLKPMLARGELRTIGATTLGEYRQHIEKDAAFERRFQMVLVSGVWLEGGVGPARLWHFGKKVAQVMCQVQGILVVQLRWGRPLRTLADQAYCCLLSARCCCFPALAHAQVFPLLLCPSLSSCQVGEPSVPDTIQILRGLKQKYEDHHGVHITDRALVVAAELSDR